MENQQHSIVLYQTDSTIVLHDNSTTEKNSLVQMALLLYTSLTRKWKSI